MTCRERTKPVSAALVLTLALAFVAVLVPAEARAARRALVVGMDSYQAFQPLANARADADAMARALAQAGYIVALEKDRSLKELQASLRAFRQTIGPDDEVVFYFSGHGVQVDGTNYLLPIDIRGNSSEEQVQDDAVSLGKILDDLGQRKPRFTLAIVDACRNNPFAGLGRSVGGRTLVAMPVGNGQMVIYAAGNGQQALDRLDANDGTRNGLFARVFVREMLKPGISIRQTLYAVREEVASLAEHAGRRQVPAIYDEVRGDFYFFPPAATAAPPTAGIADAPRASAGLAGEPAAKLAIVVGRRLKDPALLQLAQSLQQRLRFLFQADAVAAELSIKESDEATPVRLDGKPSAARRVIHFEPAPQAQSVRVTLYPDAGKPQSRRPLTMTRAQLAEPGPRALDVLVANACEAFAGRACSMELTAVPAQATQTGSTAYAIHVRHFGSPSPSVPVTSDAPLLSPVELPHDRFAYVSQKDHFVYVQDASGWARVQLWHGSSALPARVEWVPGQGLQAFDRRGVLIGWWEEANIDERFPAPAGEKGPAVPRQFY